jgi:hypothetical protein
MRSNIRTWWVASILLAATGLVPDEAVAAGGAFVVDDAEIGNIGECKVESWAGAAANHDFTSVVSPSCVVKLGLPVEFTGMYQRSRTESVWSTTGTAQAKINITPVTESHAGVGLVGALSYDLITGASTGGYFYVPLSVQLSKTVKLNINGGLTYDAIAKANYFTYGAGLEWTFIKQVALIGEVFGQLGRLPEWYPAPVNKPRVQFGVRYTPIEKIDIDAIWGHNITGENSHWLTLGLTVRF